MKELSKLSKKLDNVFEKAGLSNKYQITIVLIFIFQFTCCEYFNIAVPYLDDLPYVFIPNKLDSVFLTYEMCENSTTKLFDVDYSRSFNSLVVHLKIYCNRRKTNFIEIVYLSSGIFGSLFTYVFADYIGRKKTLLLLIPINIVSFILFGIILFENYYFMMCLLIIIGFCSYNIMITLLIYISEVVKHENIPIYICLIVSGLPICGMITFIFFNIIIKNWQITTIIFALVNLLLYILIVYILIESPVYNLLNGKIESFEENLSKIAKYNNKEILPEDLEFISSFEKKNRSSQSLRSSLSLNSINNSILNLNQPLIKENEENDIISISTITKSISSKLSYSESKMDIINDTNPLSKIVFGKFKMKDYTPIYLIKSKSQINNFLILSYIWTSCLIIKDAINFHKKSFIPNSGESIITLISYIADFIGFFIILLLFSLGKLVIHPTLVGLQLLSFIVLSFCLVTINKRTEMILIYIAEVCWNCLYLLLYIITSLIYPSVLRTKGLSYNKGFGKIGTLMGPLFFRFNNNDNFLILYHLTFSFFSIVLSYGLPQKIGFLIFENISKENESIEDDEDNYENQYQNIVDSKFKSS